MTGDGEDHRVFPARWRVLPAHPGTAPGPPGGLLPRGVSPGASETTRTRRLRGRHRPRDRSLHPRPARRRARRSPPLRVDSADETLDKVTASGGTIIRPPFPEVDLWVATVEDPAGNLLGMWQRGPRHGRCHPWRAERRYLLTVINDHRCRDGRTRIGDTA